MLNSSTVAPQDSSLLLRLAAQSNMVGPEVLDQAADAVKRSGGSIGVQLFSRISEQRESLLLFIARAIDVPLVDIDSISRESLPKSGLKPEFLAEQCALPIRQTARRMLVACADPTDGRLKAALQFQTGLGVDLALADGMRLAAYIEKLTRPLDGILKELGEQDVSLDIAAHDNTPSQEEGEVEADDAPVVRLINKLILDGIVRGASDIHFEPYEKVYRVRYRLDGRLKEVAHPPLSVKDRVASRLKIISRLDISERRVPQDGRTRVSMGKGRFVDLRVSALPTQFGEKICLRILDPANLSLGLDTLGYDDVQKANLVEAIQRPYGMVLVTGPTGSGKTVSLYTCLGILNKPDINISTAEDPVEINVTGINQVSINDRAGMTFAAALKSFLRQDPDVIMVGEIRDLETAEMAIKAAQTGHLVLSTLHTNDAPTTLTRLLNMGVPAFNVATSVSLITAQRLARRLCECKSPREVRGRIFQQAGDTTIEPDEVRITHSPNGCEECSGTGYRGRLGIYQVMPITGRMQEIIMGGGNSLDIAKQARSEGILTLREAGLKKVYSGETSLEEVLATTNLD